MSNTFFKGEEFSKGASLGPAHMWLRQFKII